MGYVGIYKGPGIKRLYSLTARTRKEAEAEMKRMHPNADFVILSDLQHLFRLFSRRYRDL